MHRVLRCQNAKQRRAQFIVPLQIAPDFLSLSFSLSFSLLYTYFLTQYDTLTINSIGQLVNWRIGELIITKLFDKQ